MDAFLTSISVFPMSIFTVALGIVLGYWMLAIFGLFGLEAFDLDVEASSDGDMNDVGGAVGLLYSLGLSGVPITIVISIIVFNAWTLCYIATSFLLDFPDFASLVQVLFQIGIAVMSFMLAVPITAFMIRPLRTLFRKLNHQPDYKTLIGTTCRVRSSRVDGGFGEVECLHDGASLILKVRSSGNATFDTGENVVLIEHQTDDNFYYVVSEHEFSKEMN